MSMLLYDKLKNVCEQHVKNTIEELLGYLFFTFFYVKLSLLQALHVITIYCHVRAYFNSFLDETIAPNGFKVPVFNLVIILNGSLTPINNKKGVLVS